MKFLINLKIGTALITCILLSIFLQINAYSQEEDKTRSPYFFVKSGDPELDQLPLKSTKVEVNISGVIADVIIEQQYQNTGKKPLEAIYIFPGSTRAAVYHMQMQVGQRILIADVYEKQKAREKYEQAKSEGKSASLLEQQRPNVFQMNVANILPGDTITLVMRYTELLIPEDNIYEFVYPTVVGPRYSSQSTGPGGSVSEPWVSNPYLEEGKKPVSTFDIQVNVSSGVTLKDIRSVSHELDISFEGKAEAICKLKNNDKYTGNKDFILQYRLAGDAIESGVLLFEGEKENFFLAMVQPQRNPSAGAIPPREYVFILDVSGSMNGFPLDLSKELMNDLLAQLTPEDRFNIMFFAGSSAVLSEKSLPATQENLKNALDNIDRQSGGGGTELLPALQRALALPGTENYSRSFVIATDGYVTVEKQAFDLIRNNLSTANFFSFGIGSSVNRYIIEGMARVGMGEPLIVTRSDEAPEKAKKFRKYIQEPVLTNIKVEYKNFEVYDVEPLTFPDLLAQRPISIFGKYRGNPKGSISINGRTGEKDYSQTLKVSKVHVDKSNIALKYLWARHKIQLLDDYANLKSYTIDKNSIQSEVTKLGLKYNLLTKYTSFVAIDTIIRNTTNEIISLKQPVPLPEGVSNYAVQGRMGSNTSMMIEDSETGQLINMRYAPTSSAVEATESAFFSPLDSKYELINSAETVKFETGKAELSEKAKETLDKIISILKSQPEHHLKLSGYCDNGESKKAEELSQQRADIVKQYIISQGVDAKRIQAKGYGEANPVATNSTPEGRALNRRVEFKVFVP